jgi:hypothetical protein
MSIVGTFLHRDVYRCDNCGRMWIASDNSEPSIEVSVDDPKFEMGATIMDVANVCKQCVANGHGFL